MTDHRTATPDQVRLLDRPHDGDSHTLVCLICRDEFAADNDHAFIHILDPNPRLDAVLAAVENHQHGRTPEL